MKYLIVNAINFGATRGINCGIFQAHQDGIVTSASFLVGRKSSLEASEMSRAMPRLSVGLMADIEQELAANVSNEQLRTALDIQLDQFHRLLDRAPTHLDANLRMVRARRALETFLDFSKENGLLLREHSMVRFVPAFHGTWQGIASSQRVTPESLAATLTNEIHIGITELGCRPGYADSHYPDRNEVGREAELRALCDPMVRETLEAESIQLISYQHIARFQNRETRYRPGLWSTIARV